MIKRSTFKAIRQKGVSLFGALLTVYLLHKGMPNTFKTVTNAVAIALCIYGALFAIDRIIGQISPIIVDLRKISNAEFDRSNPYYLAIATKTNSIIELEVDGDDNVELMKFDGRPIRRRSDREFCYLRITDKRYLKADPDIAFDLVRKIRADKGSVEVSGLSYQT
jgi:hypothetical protein